jgi:hypothetical protein
MRVIGATAGFGLVFLGGAILHGLAPITHLLDVPQLPHSVYPVIGWAGILAGLLMTHASSHGLATGSLPAPLQRLPRSGAGKVAFLVRQLGVAFLIRWAVGGVLFWCALPLLGASHARNVAASSRRQYMGCLLLYLLFYGYGVGGVWNFVGHIFAADMVAASVGWPAGTPFQQELAFYALGTGVVGLLTPWIRDRFWIAAALAPSIFVYGAALTHVRDYLANGNTAPANWSFSAIGANLIIPTIVLSLTWAYARSGGFRDSTPDGTSA